MGSRQKKHPDSDFFHYHNQNPHNRITTDCVIRAISTATGKAYEDIVILLAGIQIKTGFDPSEKDGYGKLLKHLGWEMHKQPRKADGRKYTGKEFCQALSNGELDIESNKRIIAHIGTHHLVAIMDWQVWDIWDSTGGCIGNYWTRP